MEKVGPALSARLGAATDYDTFEVNVFLPGEPASAALSRAMSEAVDAEATEDAVQGIKKAVASEQAALLSELRGLADSVLAIDSGAEVPQARAPESFWINNAIAVEVSRETLEGLLKREDVSHVELQHYASLAELIDGPSRNRSVDRQARRKRTGFAKPRARVEAAPPPPAWSVKRVNAPLLWQLGVTGGKVVVAVVDTGVNYKHPDLKKRMWVDPSVPRRYPKHGWDFWANDNDPFDQVGAPGAGHGTSCAGQVAGDGSLGTATGVAPGARIMAIRVGGAENQFWRGLQFAIDRKVHVISMSMTWKYPSSPNYPGWRRTCETILAARILHANSIGNQGTDLVTYPLPYNIATPGNCPPPRMHPLQPGPGGLSSAIACGATDDADKLANYSGRGPAAWERAPYVDYPYAGGSKPGLLKPDVCAPGPGTTSCNYLYGQVAGAAAYSGFGGTSSATPHVGGCLALLASACLKTGRPIVPARIQEALENTARRIPGQAEAKENHYGAGRVDVYAAYKYGRTRGWW
jgi:subtilisin family serine protease